MNKWFAVVPAMAVLLLVAPAAYAQAPEATTDVRGTLGIATAITMAVAAFGGALGQAMGLRAALEGIARNPQAAPRITVPMFAGLAFIESLVILAFIMAFLIQGHIG